MKKCVKEWNGIGFLLCLQHFKSATKLFIKAHISFLNYIYFLMLRTRKNINFAIVLRKTIVKKKLFFKNIKIICTMLYIFNQKIFFWYLLLCQLSIQFLLQFSLWFLMQNMSKIGSGCGAVGRVVASNSRDLQFESSRRQNLCWTFTVNSIEKTK